jgi:hypothetical protein
MNISGRSENIGGTMSGPITILLIVVQVLLAFPNMSFAAPLPNNSAVQDFTVLFNGRDLSGWDGDPRVWSVKNGVIIGQTSPVEKSDVSFLIWTSSIVTNFELRFTFRVPQANSGVAYRGKDFGNRAVFGYQYVITDMRGKGGEIGQLFESGARVNQTSWVSGRGLLGAAGAKVRIEPGRIIRPDGTPSTTIGQALSAIKADDWNEGVIVARGNHLTHFINGLVVTEVRDLDRANVSGVIALAALAIRGKGALVEFKDIRLKSIGSEATGQETATNAAAKDPAAERIKELKELRGQGLIDKETYERKVKAILDSL